jgi:WD40 repeat protein
MKAQPITEKGKNSEIVKEAIVYTRRIAGLFRALMLVGSSTLVRAAIILLACPLLLPPNCESAEVRKWVSRDGEYTVEAELSDVRDASAVLKKSDGSEVVVPLNKLSLADVNYVRKVLDDAEKSVTNREDPAKETPASEAETTSKAPATSPRRSPSRTRQPGQRASSGSGWQVRAERASDMRIANRPRPIAIGQDFAVRFITPATPSTFLAGCRQALKMSCEVWDFGRGEKVASLSDLPNPGQYHALSPDGGRLALSPLVGAKLQIWSVRNGRIEREIDLKQQFPSLNYLAFAQSARLVVGLGLEKKMQVFDCASGEEVCSVPADFSVMAKQISLSNAGGYLAIPNPLDRCVRFYDLQQGDPAGILSLPSLADQVTGIEGTAFSPDGTEFAALVTTIKGGAIVCWNVNDGSHSLTITLDKSPSLLVESGAAYQGAPLEFVANKGWLVYGRGFVDRKQRQFVWSEKSTDPLSATLVRRVLPDGRVFRTSGSGNTTVYAVEELPWQEIRESSTAVAKGGKPSDAGLPAITASSWSGVKNISHSGREAWTAQPASAPVAEAAFRAKPINLGCAAFLVHRITMSAPEARRAMIATMVQRASGLAMTDSQFSQQALVLDLEKAAPAQTLSPAFPTEFLDMSPGGDRLLSRTGKEHDRLDVWHADSGEHVLAFRPFETDSFPVKMVHAAWLLDEKRMLTFGSNGKLTTWSLPQCKAVYSLDLAASVNAFLFPPVCLDSRRTRFAVVSVPSVRMVDAVNGQCLGTFAGPMDFGDDGICTRLAFSPDDAQLAMTWSRAGEERLAVWDAGTGKLVRDVVLDAGGSELVWAAPGQVVIEGFRKTAGRRRFDAPDMQNRIADLFDVKRGFVTWRYALPLGRLAGWGPGQCAWYVTCESLTTNGVFYPLALPTGECTAAMNKVPEPRTALTKGSQLGLAIQLKLRDGSPASEPLEKEVRDHLEKQIRLSGMQIAERAPFALRVQIDEGTKGDFLTVYPLSDSERETVVEGLAVLCQMTLTDASGTVYWHRVKLFPAVDRPTMRPSDSRTSFIQTARKEQWKRVVGWFASEPFPQEISDPRDRQAIGESVLGARGEENLHSLR